MGLTKTTLITVHKTSHISLYRKLINFVSMWGNPACISTSYWWQFLHIKQVLDLTRLLVTVHAVVFVIFTAWIVLGPARLVQIMALPAKRIQQYWQQIISGNGATKRGWKTTRNSLTTFTLLEVNTIRISLYFMAHCPSRWNAPIQDPAKVELDQRVKSDIKVPCVQLVLTITTSDLTDVWNVQAWLLQSFHVL